MSRFIRGVSVTLGTRVASLLIGIASAVIVARALGPAGKGEYALIVLIPAFFQLAGGLGLDQAMVYLVARRRRESRAIAFTVLVTSVGLGILLLGAYAALTAFPPYISYLETVRVEAELIWLLILLLPLTLATQSLTAALLALERYRDFNIATSVFDGTTTLNGRDSSTTMLSIISVGTPSLSVVVVLKAMINLSLFHQRPPLRLVAVCWVSRLPLFGRHLFPHSRPIRFRDGHVFAKALRGLVCGCFPSGWSSSTAGGYRAFD